MKVIVAQIAIVAIPTGNHPQWASNLWNLKTKRAKTIAIKLVIAQIIIVVVGRSSAKSLISSSTSVARFSAMGTTSPSRSWEKAITLLITTSVTQIKSTASADGELNKLLSPR